MDFFYIVGFIILVEVFVLGIFVICLCNFNFEMDIDKEEIGIIVVYDDVEGWINVIYCIVDYFEEV